MKYDLKTTSNFDKEFKKLAKKYPSLLTDMMDLVEVLKVNPTTGTSIGNNLYKIRLSIKSKGKGKSGGARVITHIKILATTIYLISIYDKSEKTTITSKELKDFLKEIQ